MDVRIVAEAFDPLEEIRQFQSRHPELARHCGARTQFIGTMREHNEGDAVRAMRLEHYPEMTQAHLEEIAEAACKKHELSEVLLVHRVGDMQPGDDIVLVAVWAAHRKAAYEGNREIMEALKSTAPFWKREELEDGSQRWVESNTEG